MTIFTALWWKAALIRAGRTALVVAVPYVPASYLGSVPYLSILSAAVLAFILSLLTSLAGLSEVNGVARPWWYAILARVVKTTAQALVANIGTSVFISQLDYHVLLQVTVTAAFGSLLLGVLAALPEAPKPVAAAILPTVTVSSNEYTTTVNTQAPVLKVDAPLPGPITSTADQTAAKAPVKASAPKRGTTK